MKKSEQIAINEKVEQAHEDFYSYLAEFEGDIVEKRLRTMSARVRDCEDGKYYYLISYNTVVAIIDKETDTLYDFLRLVYGYTATSAKHISAFGHDYGQGKWDCAERLTWREV